MTSLQPKPHWWHNSIKRVFATRLGTWFVANALHHIDRPFIKFSKGHNSPSRFLAGLPVVTLTAIGAKSGEPRSIPLAGIPDGDKIVLIGTNFGHRHNPSWYYNLTANPEASLSFSGQTNTYLAHEAEGEEYDRCWQKAVDLYKGYKGYKIRAGRHIPIMVLTLRE
jgi:deazaflavin-dependent oxidoreductase (nitroreductase family)